MSEDEVLSDPLMVGRVVVGYITAPPTTTTTTEDTATNDTVQNSLERILDTLELPTSHTPNTAYFKDALAAFRTAGLLTAKPHTTTSTTTTMPPPPPPSSANKPSTQRPSLISRDTDNWNDIPETFLSPDFSSTNGGSLGRRKVRGTPRITPRGSLGSLRQTSVTSGPPMTASLGGVDDGERSWDEIMKETERLVSRSS